MSHRPTETPVRIRPVVSVSTFHGPDRPVVRVGGEVDLATAPLLDRHLSTTIGPHEPEVVIDLRMVSFMDASGLAVLIRADNQARSHGGRLRLTGVPDHLTRLLRATRLDAHFLRDDGPGSEAAGPDG